MATAKEKSGFRGPEVVLSALAAVLFLYALVLFLQGGFQAVQAREFETKVYGAVNEETEASLAAQKALLNDPARWVDQEQGRIAIPIEDAKARFVEKYREDAK
jgi:hypothetical protein